MKYFAIFVAVLLLVSYGCASKTVQPTQRAQGVSAGDQAGSDQEEARKRKEREARVIEEDLARARQERERQERERLLQEKMRAPVTDIYFDYDSSAVKPEDLPKLKEVSDWLKANREVSVMVEGHCDERGAIEYNLALGQKRAEVVKNHLLKLGVDDKRIRTISYGKEMPADPGHTEEAWAKNRRVHFKIDQKG
jgi:peptidoglycan-associated lipoprotein